MAKKADASVEPSYKNLAHHVLSLLGNPGSVQELEMFLNTASSLVNNLKIQSMQLLDFPGHLVHGAFREASEILILLPPRSALRYTELLLPESLQLIRNFCKIFFFPSRAMSLTSVVSPTVHIEY